MLPDLCLLRLRNPTGTDPDLPTVCGMTCFLGKSGHGHTAWHTQEQAHWYTGSHSCQDTGRTLDGTVSAQAGFSHPGNPQRGYRAGVAGRMHDGGGAVTRVWGLWRPPRYLNRCSQAVDSHGVPGGGGRSQKSLFLCEWPDQMAAYPTAWGFSSTKSPKKRVEVEALMKSGALGLPTRPQLQPWEALLDQSTEPAGLQSSLRHENLGPAAQTMHKTTAVCTAFQGVHGPLEYHY